ncbi:MAG: Rv3235 family protein [Propionibacteriaceae bacterium]|nr:Rv3235 family protein [Propionibacteriaceae bacterium]
MPTLTCERSVASDTEADDLLGPEGARCHLRTLSTPPAWSWRRHHRLLPSPLGPTAFESPPPSPDSVGETTCGAASGPDTALAAITGGLSVSTPSAGGSSSTSHPPVVRRSPVTAPELYRLAVHLAQGIVEVLNGRRPSGHLTAWLSDTALAGFEQGRSRLGSGTVKLGSLHVQVPRARAAEVTVRLDTAQRNHPAALGLAKGDDGWVCVAFTLG